MKTKSYLITTALVIGIIIMLNLVGDRFSFRKDFTEDGTYTLSDATRKILKDLKQPVTIKAYFSEDLPPDVQKTRRDFMDMLTEYNRLSGGNIVYSFVNPNESQELEQDAMQNGIEPVIINVRDKDQMKQQKAYLGAVVSMGEVKEAIPFMQPGGAMEYALTTSIKKLSLTEKPYVGLIVGHGEPTVDYYSQANQALTVLYNFQAFKMDSTNEEIPDQFKTIAIVNPTDTISPAHFKIFDNFINRGGKVYVAINRVSGDLQQSMGFAVNTGLEAWLKSNDIDVDEYFVADANCGTVTVQQNQGTFRFNTNINFPFLPVALKFANHPVSRGLESVYFPFVSPVRFTGDTSLVHFTPVVFSSENSSLLRAPQFFDIQKQWGKPDFNQKNVVLAACFERKTSKGVFVPYMFVAGDGDFAINGPRGEAQQLMPDNVNLMVNAIDWLTDETGLIDLRTREILSRPIDNMEDATKTLLKWINFMLPVLLIILVGVYRFYRMKILRRKRMEDRYE